MKSIKLVVGNTYKIIHKRKGCFIGQLIDVVEGDSADSQFLTFKYDVRAETDQARLAVNPGKGKVRVSNLRPSLVTKIEEVEGNEWLRNQIVPAELRRKEERRFVNRLFGVRSN